MSDQVVLPNFSKGELAAELWGRVDTQQYGASLRKARNFIVQRYGGVSFRPGTQLIGKVDDSTKPVRLVPFQFSIDQAYVLAMDQGGMRPLANGGFVLEDNLKITNLTKAAMPVLTVANHGLVVGDRIYLSGIVGMVQLNGRIAKVVSVLDASHFTIDINTTGFGTFVSSDGMIRASPPPAPPTPPTVPPVTPDPDPPTTGGGGGTPFKPPIGRPNLP